MLHKVGQREWQLVLEDNERPVDEAVAYVEREGRRSYWDCKVTVFADGQCVEQVFGVRNVHVAEKKARKLMELHGLIEKVTQ